EAVLAQRPTAGHRPSPLGPVQIDSEPVAVSDLSSPEEDWGVEMLPAALTAEPSPSPTASDPEAPGFHSPLASGWTLASFVPFALTIWVIGTAAWFAAAGARIYGFHRLLRYGKAAPAALQEQTRLLAERLGLTHCPTVWLVPGQVSPLLWALGGKCCLVVPAVVLRGGR